MAVSEDNSTQTLELLSSLQRDQCIRVWGQRWLLLHAVLGLVFLYLPILILIVYSFNASRSNAIWRGFTWRWYASLIQGGDALGLGSSGGAVSVGGSIWSALHNSLLIATVTTIISTVLGTLLAIAMERYQFRGRNAVVALIYLPVIIPEITMGISLLVFFTLLFRLVENITGIRLNLGLATVIIGHIAFSLSFVTIVVRARLADLDPVLDEAAMDLGANEWRILWRITLPLLRPAIFSGALLAFTLSLDDFVVTFFTAGIGSTTLPLFVYSMVRFSITPAINAISTLMLLASMILVVAAVVGQRRQHSNLS